MKKKLVVPVLSAALLTGVGMGVGALVSADNTAATPTANVAAPSRMNPGVDGNITAINGTTVTVTEEANEGSTVYNVDASAVASKVSGLAVGNKVFVQGTVSGSNVAATDLSTGGPGGRGGHGMGMGPHVDGNVTAVSGSTITLTEEADENSTVYTVDASSATVTKNGSASQLSAIAVGDKIFVQGTTTGSNVKATSIMAGQPQGRPGRGMKN